MDVHCTYMRKTAFLRFINLKVKFCFWIFASADPNRGSPDPETWTPGHKNLDTLLALSCIMS